MKNKKIIITALITIAGLGNLPLQAVGNTDVSTFEHTNISYEDSFEGFTDDAPEGSYNVSETSWLAKHRNKVLLITGSMIVLALGAYAWNKHKDKGNNNTGLQENTQNKLQKKEDQSENQSESLSFQKNYTELLKEIDTVLNTEGSPYNKIYKAGLVELPTLTPPTHIDKNALCKLAVLKSMLNNPEIIKKYAHEVIYELGDADEFYAQLSLDKLIDEALPAMVKTAATKLNVILKGACKRSGKDANTIKLSNVYQPGTELTAQEALTQVTTSTQPFVALQRAQRLSDILSYFENNENDSKLAQAKRAYKGVLEKYKNSTKEGSVYSKLRDEIGIDLLKKDVELDEMELLKGLSTKAVSVQEPDTVATYKKATAAMPTLHDEDLIKWAWGKITSEVEGIAFHTWPTNNEDSFDINSLVGKEVEEAVFTEALSDSNIINTFDTLKTQLGTLIKAARNKVKAALEAANKRSGKDQNNTRLPNLDEAGTPPLTVHEALAQLNDDKRKPFEILEHASRIINALTSISNKAWVKAKKDLKEIFHLNIKRAGQGSAHSKAAAAQVPRLPKTHLPSNRESPAFQKYVEDSIDFKYTMLEIHNLLQENSKLVEELEETAITDHTRKEITKIAHDLTEEARKLNDQIIASSKEPHPEGNSQEVTQELLFGQDLSEKSLSEKSLDDLIHKVIPQMITLVLAKIDASIEILSKTTTVNQQIIGKRAAIRNNKTFHALEEALSIIKLLASPHDINQEFSLDLTNILMNNGADFSSDEN